MKFEVWMGDVQLPSQGVATLSARVDPNVAVDSVWVRATSPQADDAVWVHSVRLGVNVFTVSKPLYYYKTKTGDDTFAAHLMSARTFDESGALVVTLENCDVKGNAHRLTVSYLAERVSP